MSAALQRDPLSVVADDASCDRLGAALANLLASAWRAHQAASQPDGEAARDHIEGRADQVRADVGNHSLGVDGRPTR